MFAKDFIYVSFIHYKTKKQGPTGLIFIPARAHIFILFWLKTL